jgi:FkbM family methyltransferase
MLSSFKSFLKRKVFGNSGKAVLHSSLSPLDIYLSLRMARNETISVVQIGASDGERNDPLRNYILKYPGLINAVLVEPLPDAVENLQKLYQGSQYVKICHAALSYVDGKQKIYSVVKDCPYMADQLSSFDRNHLLDNGVKSKHIETIEVDTVRLESLYSKYNLQSVDLFQIDTEGFDKEIVKMLLKMPSSFHPEAINFEHLHVPENELSHLCQLLQDAGYGFARSDWDTFALKSDLLEHN